MEIIKELPLVDYILVPVGGGGLATGVSTLAKLLNPKIKVIGVEPAGANCLQESFKAGKPVTLQKISTIADGTAVKTPGKTSSLICRKGLTMLSQWKTRNSSLLSLIWWRTTSSSSKIQGFCRWQLSDI